MVRILPSQQGTFQYRGIHLDQRFSPIIGYGLCFLIVFPPLAFGAVYPWGFSILELVCFALVLVWMLATRQTERDHSTKTKNTASPFYLPFAIFIGLILFQMLPMPPAILRTISPETYTLYCETLDGYGKDSGQHSAFSGQNLDEEWGPTTLDLQESRGLGRNKLERESSLQETQSRGFLHDWRSLSVYRHATKAELLKILAYASVFFLILFWVDDRSKLLPLLYLMILMGSLISIIGIVQRLVGAERIYGLWRPFFRTGQSSFGSYVNPNHFAGYMALIIPIAVSLFIRQVERIGWSKAWELRDYLKSLNEQDIHMALFLLLALVFMVSGLFLSLSRGGIFAFAGSMIFLIIALSIKGGWRLMLGLGLMTGFFAAVFVFWLGFVPFEASIKTFAHLFQDTTVQYRLQVWQDGWRMLMDFPLFGTGLGTFAHIYPKYKTIIGQATVMYPENDFLQILVETGFVGFGVLTWFFAAFFHALWIRWKSHETYLARINPKIMVGLAAAMVAILIHGFGDFNLHIPANALLFAIVMGLAMTVKGEKGNFQGQ